MINVYRTCKTRVTEKLNLQLFCNDLLEPAKMQIIVQLKISVVHSVPWARVLVVYKGNHDIFCVNMSGSRGEKYMCDWLLPYSPLHFNIDKKGWDVAKKNWFLYIFDFEYYSHPTLNFMLILLFLLWWWWCWWWRRAHHSLFHLKGI